MVSVNTRDRIRPLCSSGYNRIHKDIDYVSPDFVVVPLDQGRGVDVELLQRLSLSAISSWLKLPLNFQSF